VSRSSGGAAANALAYETGNALHRIDGQIVDFSGKGVEQSAIIGTRDDLQTLADKMELAENRKDSTVARRMTIALPHELSKEERWNCAEEFAQFMHDEFSLAVVVSMHAPDTGGDQRNHHAHLTMSDRKVDEEGNLGKKARELTSRQGGEAKKNLEKIRKQWADICNGALERAGEEERVDHRSYEEQGIDKTPTQHLGKAKSEIIRKEKYTVTDELTNEHTAEKNKKQDLPAFKPFEEMTYEEKVRRVIGDEVEIIPEEEFNKQKEDVQQQERSRDRELDSTAPREGDRNQRVKEDKPKFGTAEWWIKDAGQIAREVIGICREELGKLRELQKELSDALREYGGESLQDRQSRRAQAGRGAEVSASSPGVPREEVKYDHDGESYTDNGEYMPDWRAFEKLEALKRYPEDVKKWNPKALKKAQKELPEQDFGMER